MSKIILQAFATFLIGFFFIFPILASEEKNQRDLMSPQEYTFEQLQKNSNGLNVYWYKDKNTPRAIVAEKINLPADSNGKSREEKSYIFFEEYKNLYLLDQPRQNLKLRREQRDDSGMHYMHFYQYYQGIPVYGLEMIVHFDKHDNLVGLTGRVLPNINIEINPKITKEQAQAKAIEDLFDMETVISGNVDRYKDTQIDKEPVLFIYNNENKGIILVYRVNINGWVYFVDAYTEVIEKKYNNIKNVILNTYSAGGGTTSADLWITEDTDDPTVYSEHTDTDDDARNVHGFARDTYEYYFANHSRDSYDGDGININSVVHYGSGNASWDGEYLKYNEGYTDANDVVAHEFTHAVDEYSIFGEDSDGDGELDPVGLQYSDESGALNESYSDIFAAMVDGDDWTIGEDLGTTIRDMSDPSSIDASYPDTYSNYIDKYDTTCLTLFVSDYDEWESGCVHYNSNINNKAIYLMGREPDEGVITFNSIDVEGIGREKTAEIAYQTLITQLYETANFEDNFYGMLLSCIYLSRDASTGISTEDCEAVFDAYTAIEVADGSLTYRKAVIEVDSDSGAAPLTVSFDGTDSVSFGRNITNYAWDFGDGSTDSGDTVNHTYTSTGTFTVTLTITDSDGGTASTTEDITVTNPLASTFTITGDGVAAPATVSFDASATTDATGTITDYTWDFGDGSTALSTGTTPTTSYTYTSDGYYVVTLTVTDNAGYTATYSHGVYLGSNGVTTLGGSLSTDTWTTTHSPYLIDNNLTVAVG